MPGSQKNSLQKFLNRIQKSKDPNGCWIWLGGKQTNGYGTFTGIEPFKYDRPHRLSYKHFVGPIPEGLDVMHKCDNRACVNPAHLTCGTRKDNMDDCVSKGRQQRGENHAFAVFTEKDVLAMRELHARGYRIYEIAEWFGAHFGAVSKIVRRERWKHI